MRYLLTEIVEIVMKRFLMSFLLILSFSIFVLATAQTPDVLIYDSKTYDLFSNPLESRYNGENRPTFWVSPNTQSSGNWRGYVATWEIVNNNLYLIKIDSWFCKTSIRTKNGCRQITLRDLFGKTVENGKVSASWFSGSLNVPDGKLLEYVHMGYGSVYERDIIFKVESGKIVKQEVIDNTKRTLPSNLELQRQELERMRKSSEEDKPVTEKTKINNKGFVVAGEGWGIVRLNATRTDIENALGKGKLRSKYNDVYFIDFEEIGVQVSFNNSDNRVKAIFFYNHQQLDENLEVFNGETDKGINWSSSEEDILRTYGKPKNDYSGIGWRRLVFDGIDFRFENKKLVRIGIPGN